MCNLLKSGDWTVERDEDLTAPYAFSKTTWLAFEDEISVNIKVNGNKMPNNLVDHKNN